ncbi:type 4a pilus biogenesis protein PilO [Vibrio sp. S4M6]|uniref:type 4a pilus biogenesis protein PilO n=1 Tax=Vibrio sinus TaxID=2946865 RepID=UPI00202A6232|nr:type 4a pilus biogenesis protein PilO [Vibrio sinus]MCL9780432.1 type 4a pilus biogenesis protein PilO [Vibrio sinus]
MQKVREKHEIAIEMIANGGIFAKCALLLGFSLITLWLGYWLFLSSKIDQLQSSVSNEHRLKSALVAKGRQVIEQHELLNQLKSLRQRNDALESQLSKRHDSAQFLKDMHNIAKSTKINISQLQWRRMKVHTPLIMYPFSMKITGNWRSIGHFLHKLAEYPTPIVVKELMWHREHLDNELLQVNVEARVLVHQ